MKTKREHVTSLSLSGSAIYADVTLNVCLRFSCVYSVWTTFNMFLSLGNKSMLIEKRVQRQKNLKIKKNIHTYTGFSFSYKKTKV